jgi:hypothetical protein
MVSSSSYWSVALLARGEQVGVGVHDNNSFAVDLDLDLDLDFGDLRTEGAKGGQSIVSG